MSLAALVIDVHQTLDAAGIPHAFGGALALDYIADPRGTVDVDVNVFAGTEEIDDVLVVLATLGLRPEAERQAWMPAAGIRLWRDDDPFPVDVFPSLDDAYAEVRRRTVVHPFGPERLPLPFLSAEDLVLFKLSFGRSKDWVDLAAIADVTPDLDVGYIERQLLALRGPSMHPRLVRLRSMLRDAGQPRTPEP